MTRLSRYAEYLCFGFAYFMDKAYFAAAEGKRV